MKLEYQISATGISFYSYNANIVERNRDFSTHTLGIIAISYATLGIPIQYSELIMDDLDGLSR